MLRIAFIACLAVLTAFANPPLTRVAVAGGEIQGAEQNGVRRFLSVPYAAAPVGELRWRAPQPVQAWDGVRDGTHFGPSCTQNISASGWGPWTREFSPQGAASEDCLTLSVWTPARGANERLPVLIWIPGGGFTDGGEATPLLDGQALAEQGIVVVSINYRVAAFGTLAHPALEAEPDGGRGNYALRDALAALQWVNANIERFGGDEHQVTIAGQSAGGALVYAMLDAPQASGMFHRAIIQSFAPGSHSFATREQAERDGAAFATALGATDAAQMRAATAADVLRVSSDMHLDLHVDGATIREPFGASLPLLNDVPIMMGITADEASWVPEDAARTRTRLAEYGANFARLYPAEDDAALRDAALLSDRHSTLVAMERWATARSARSARNGAELYLYLWTHTLPGPDAARYRAFHSSEVPYMFGALDAAPERGFTAIDREISARMVAYWSNFVKTGDPNGADLPAWPSSAEAPAYMELGDNFASVSPMNDDVRTFWNQRFDAAREYRF